MVTRSWTSETMQTFMTHHSPSVIASHLDNRRLNKQITEALQIVDANLIGTGWRHHPAVKMWTGHEFNLALYTQYMILEWWDRGYTSHHGSDTQVQVLLEELSPTLWPDWWGDPKMVLSHQSNLVRKDPEYYGPLFLGVPDDLPYIWPTKLERI